MKQSTAGLALKQPGQQVMRVAARYRSSQLAFGVALGRDLLDILLSSLLSCEKHLIGDQP